MGIPASHRNCPVGHATALLGDRWSLLIVREALAGETRYGQFKKTLQISDNTLTRRLSHLQDIGVLQRNANEPTCYDLTEAGHDLARVLAILGDWSMRWLPVDRPLRQVPQPVFAAAELLGLPIAEHLA